VNYGLDKAIAYDETGFLGPNDEAYRRQAWNFILSGGSTFGALDYSFTVGHEDGPDTSSNGPGGGSPTFRLTAERPQSCASIIQVAILLGKAEAQQILAVPGTEKRRPSNRGHTSFSQQVPSLLRCILAR
jgi:hypothetical protein